MNFAQISKELREETGFSQQKLGKELGLSSSGIAHLELGQREPGSATLIAYSKYFGVTTDYLLGLSDDFSIRTPAPMGDGLTSEERDLIADFRRLSPYLQDIAKNTVRGLSGADLSDLHKKA